MTSTDRIDDLVPAQQMLEWVTPHISLMAAVDTNGSKTNNLFGEGERLTDGEGGVIITFGTS